MLSFSLPLGRLSILTCAQGHGHGGLSKGTFQLTESFTAVPLRVCVCRWSIGNKTIAIFQPFPPSLIHRGRERRIVVQQRVVSQMTSLQPHRIPSAAAGWRKENQTCPPSNHTNHHHTGVWLERFCPPDRLTQKYPRRAGRKHTHAHTHNFPTGPRDPSFFDPRNKHTGAAQGSSVMGVLCAAGPH